MEDNMDDSQPSTRAPLMVDSRGYALSGKIMLSAIVLLLTVIIIIMVCLRVYARWFILRARRRHIRRARRRPHVVFYIGPMPTAAAAIVAPVPSRGLDVALLKSLPTFTYHKGGGGGAAAADVEEGERSGSGLECAVCLSEFEEEEKGRMLPKCKHSFHVECIDMWFHSHTTCPICRATVDGGDFPCVDPTVGEIVVELTELTRNFTELNESTRVELRGTASFGGRMKGSERVEVPRRCQSFGFSNSDESGPSQGHRSPTSRILSLKRILSRERKSPLPSRTASGTNHGELEVELGRVEEVSQPSQVVTTR